MRRNARNANVIRSAHRLLFCTALAAMMMLVAPHIAGAAGPPHPTGAAGPPPHDFGATGAHWPDGVTPHVPGGPAANPADRNLPPISGGGTPQLPDAVTPQLPGSGPPHVRGACSGLFGAAAGLCNAFCNAQNCPATPSKQSCASLRKNFEKQTG